MILLSYKLVTLSNFLANDDIPLPVVWKKPIAHTVPVETRTRVGSAPKFRKEKKMRREARQRERWLCKEGFVPKLQKEEVKQSHKGEK
eukprot:8887518-Ditylum_brightwellii.AAC.1